MDEIPLDNDGPTQEEMDEIPLDADEDSTGDADAADSNVSDDEDSDYGNFDVVDDDVFSTSIPSTPKEIVVEEEAVVAEEDTNNDQPNTIESDVVVGAKSSDPTTQDHVTVRFQKRPKVIA